MRENVIVHFRLYGNVEVSLVKASQSRLLQRHQEMNIEHIDVENSFCAQRLLKRMKFVRGFGTTGKVNISEPVRRG